MISTLRRWLEDWRHRHDMIPDQLRQILWDDCRDCGRQTQGFDEGGPICIDCAVVKALREGA